jgi:hypothetical protein
MNLHPRRLGFIVLCISGMSIATAARADDFIVYSPYVVQGQSEVELRSAYQHDSDPAVNSTLDYEFSLSHAFTDWWRPEVYLGKFERAPGAGNHLLGYELENFFQLSTQGEYWADAGFVLSYDHKGQPGVQTTLEFGPLFEKRNGRFDQRLNLIWEKELGSGAGRRFALRAAYSLSYRLDGAFAPGFETYLRPADNSYSIGPVLNGELLSGTGSELEYRLGVVFGVNPGAPNAVWVAQLEYEFY